MDEIRQRLETELNHTMGRIRQLGGSVMLEEFPGAVGDNSPLADEVDVIDRANKLAEALERLRGGEYGLCEECNEPIAPKRLLAMPEVARCVRCQDRLERSRHLETVAAGVEGDDQEDD